MSIQSQVVQNISLLRIDVLLAKLFDATKSLKVCDEMHKSNLMTTHFANDLAHLLEIFDHKLASVIFQDFIHGGIEILKPFQREFMKLS